MAEKVKYILRVLNQEFTIIVENEIVGNEINEYINTLITQIAKGLADQPEKNVLIRACISSAYELYKVKEENTELKKQINTISEQLTELKNLLLENNAITYDLAQQESVEKE